MLDAISAHALHARNLLGEYWNENADCRFQNLLDIYDLKLKRVGPSSALLYGADACIDPTTRTIRMRRDLNDISQREILAHELAHVILGHEELGASVQSRDYVSSYGRSERIERMADNLAAVLLVTDDELEAARETCNSLTEATSFLQVSNATLLRRLTLNHSPVVSDDTSTFTSLPYQCLAIEHAGNVCIDGGIGTGKTEVLLERLRKIARLESAGHSRILFVTYLRRHMVYLFERLTKSAPLLAERVNFTTFHDYAADIILRNYADAGWIEPPVVVGKGEVVDLLNRWFPAESSVEIERMYSDYKQTLRHELSGVEPWKASITEQLYRLNYIHNGSLGLIASRLMEQADIANDEADRWDAIFVDNYEQLTYDELTILRLAGKKAQYGISVACGYSALPYAFRGVSNTSIDMWKEECNFQTANFDESERQRPIPSMEVITAANSVLAVVSIVGDLLKTVDRNEKIIVAVRHNADVKTCVKALSVAGLHTSQIEPPISDKVYSLYSSLNTPAAFSELLDRWWEVYRDCGGNERSQLTSVLTNAYMYASYCERARSVGLPLVSIETFLESIRPHHQYRDIQLPDQISVQTLHSLSGCEIEHLVILMHEENSNDSHPETIKLEEAALIENAIARATRTVTIVRNSDEAPV